MDFEKLAEPYKKKPERQRAFVIRNGIPEDIADMAMAEVYAEMSAGNLKFDTPAEFDLYILKVAKSKINQSHIDAVKRLAESIDQLKKHMDDEWERLGKMKKIWEVLRGRA